MRDVRKESNSLRDMMKPFRAPVSLIEEDDAMIHALSSEFMVQDGKKFYFAISRGYELPKAFCPNCKQQTPAFAVPLKDHSDFPGAVLAAFQGDTCCKMIQVVDIKPKD